MISLIRPDNSDSDLLLPNEDGGDESGPLRNLSRILPMRSTSFEDTDDDNFDHEHSDGALSADEYSADVLNTIGFGKFQWIILLICGLANSTDSIELLSVSFLISSRAQCDLELSDTRKSLLTSVAFGGMIFGGFTFGLLSDHFGRRKALAFAMLVNTLGLGMGALSSTWVEFLFWRVVAGIGVGGSTPVLFAYCSECVSPKRRGVALTAVASFWTFGTVLVSILALVILGRDPCPNNTQKLALAEMCSQIQATPCENIHLFGSTISGWRLFMGSCAILPLVAIVPPLLMPESPQWLLANKQYKKAHNVYTKIAAWNKQKMPIALAELAPNRRSDSTGCLKIIIALFMGSSKKQMLYLIGVWFTLCFSYYGFRIWMTEFFNDGGIPGESNVYLATLWVALANIPGYMASAWTVDRIGRRWTLIVSMAVTGGAIFGVLAVKGSNGALIFSSVFGAVSAGAWCALDILSVERFSTVSRSTAMSLLSIAGRIGAICGTNSFGLFAGSAFVTPLICTGVSFALGSLLCYLLPPVQFASG